MRRIWCWFLLLLTFLLFSWFLRFFLFLWLSRLLFLLGFLFRFLLLCLFFLLSFWCLLLFWFFLLLCLLFSWLFFFWFLLFGGLIFCLLFLSRSFFSTLLEFEILKVFHLLFLFNNNKQWTSDRDWLISISFLSQKSFFCDFKPNSCFISFNLTYDISFFKLISNFLNPFNNFTLWHGRW